MSNSALAGSAYVGCSNSPQSTHRNSYPKGAYFTRSSSSAAKISGSVDLGPISVGATSGFSTNVQEQWHAVAGPIWLCGTYNLPRYAGVIHAQSQ